MGTCSQTSVGFKLGLGHKLEAMKVELFAIGCECVMN